LGIYLTNTLEQAAKKSEMLLAKFISDESDAAASIKRDQPIMVVLGNPPYANFGMMNKGEWIGDLLDDYKKGLHEKKLNLDDDFIKFLRFGQWRIEKSGAGILAFITNNTYIDGITHRRMRQSLLETFSDIYILDLHGSSKKKEKAPDGSKDENVFDIQQGVAIALFVKEARPDRSLRPVRSARVHHAELWGTRESKYEQLSETDVATTKWTEIEPKPEQFFFIGRTDRHAEEYKGYWTIAEIFSYFNSALQTKRDRLTIHFDRESLNRVLTDFRSENPETLRARYDLRSDGRDWSVASAKQDILRNDGRIIPIQYKPFDFRWTYFTGKTKGFLAYPRADLTTNLLHPNIALASVRQIVGVADLCEVFVSRCAMTDRSMFSTHGAPYLFPLYIYSALANDRAPNLSPAFIAEVEARLGLKFVSDGAGDVGATLRGRPDAQTGQTQGQPHRAAPTTFGPEDIFHYIYAVFHCPTYRQRYAEFLKIDFPRLPLTCDVKLFRALVAKGAELVALHLLESPTLEKLVTRFPVAGSNEVEKPSYVAEWKDASGKTHKGCVFINKTQFFAGIAPDVWDFHIGGYQVLDKWLKDRKGRLLSYDDITHYQKIVVALKETIRLMNEIDATIPKWPIE
jgi:predicted helicase